MKVESKSAIVMSQLSKESIMKGMESKEVVS